MSAEFPTLAEVLLRADMNHPTYGTPEFADYQADMWREACTVRTVEQLDALPLGSILLTAAQNPVQKAHADGLWWMAYRDRPMPTHLMVGFQLIWHPDWAAS